MKTDPKTFSTLATELPPTSKQRVFGKELAADPDRKATRSARAAGAGRGAEVNRVRSRPRHPTRTVRSLGYRKARMAATPT